MWKRIAGGGNPTLVTWRNLPALAFAWLIAALALIAVAFVAVEIVTALL